MNTPFTMRLYRSHWQQMYDHVLGALPDEACGLLAGKDGSSVQYFPITNQLHSPVNFFMEPRELLIAMQTIDDLGLELLATVHSHPDGPLHPSVSDLREYLYTETPALIWGPVGMPGSLNFECFAYWIAADHFDPIQLEIV